MHKDSEIVTTQRGSSVPVNFHVLFVLLRVSLLTLSVWLPSRRKFIITSQVFPGNILVILWAGISSPLLPMHSLFFLAYLSIELSIVACIFLLFEYEKSHHRFMCLNIWSLYRGTVWGRLWNLWYIRLADRGGHWGHVFEMIAGFYFWSYLLYPPSS